MASSCSDFAPTYSSSQSCNYDVFLSFRGEDTRKTFVDHLYSALVDRKISTYKDDETLGRGESISPSLFKAIEGSKIAVIIFSENYADSSWCLEELAHIMKCKDERKLIVMPIFYGLVPSEVRKQEGHFGKGFAKQEAGNTNKVETWRKALVDACEIAGWETKNIANGHESKGIKEIVDTVSNKLFFITPGVDEDLVGMKARLEELEEKLKIGSDGVHMVGIWGCGGSGKTTLASSIYTKISSQFQGHCIVESIREKSNKHGLETLQEKLLSRLLNTKVEVQSVEKGKDMIRSRLGHSNVLIFLDDVDNYKQLDALAGSHNWFGSGSRIIITTRDEHLLITHKVDHVYPVKMLSHEEAVKLFNKRAYNEKKHVKGYGTLASSVVSYAAGLPLALKVLGSFLYERDEKEWRSTLIRLKDTPPTEILEQLKISYDGLESVDKELFLDIACFFRKESIDKATKIFEACGYHPDIGITMLREKALITIMDGKFDMHDLIQEMGHNIVRKEQNPEKHSRLWKDEEIKTMCLGDATMENHNIKAIHYDGDPSLFCKIVSNKKTLRWLSLTKSINFNVKDVRNVEAPSFLSNELCYIHLEYYPESPFPDSFQPMKPVTLKLVYSLQKELWKGCKILPHLKELELFNMTNLLSTPDFDGLRFLQKLKLYGCRKLKNIHPSLGNHACIEDVCVSLCYKIRMFPTVIQMGNLKTLKFFQCSHHLEFPNIKSNMESLVKLSLNNMGIDLLLSSIGEERFPNLSSLNLTCCYLKNREANYYAFKHLEEFRLMGFSHLMPSRVVIPWLIGKVVTGRDRYQSARLTWLPSVLSQSTHSLRKLDLGNCRLRDGEIPSHIGELSNLRELDLSLNNFSRLDFSLLPLTQLKHLDLSFCKHLVELPELPSSLAILEANCCKSLRTIGDFHKNYKWICQVSFMATSSLTDSNMLLHSMLQGKVIENHSMLLKLEGLEIAKGFTPPLVRGRTYRLNLPENWCNEYCGFLMCAVVKRGGSVTYQRIEMDNRMSDMDSEDDVAWEESDGDKCTLVFYVSFATLQHSPWWNSTYKAVSISNIYHLDDLLDDPICKAIGVRLVARKSGSGPMETSATQEESESSHYTPMFEISHIPTTLNISFPNKYLDAFPDYHDSGNISEVPKWLLAQWYWLMVKAWDL